MRRLFLLGSIILGCLAPQEIHAQGSIQFKSKTSDTIRTVYIWHTDTLREKKVDSVTSIQSLFGHVKLQNEKTLFYCDSVAMNQSNNIIEAFGHVHINDSDTTDIYSQYMKYFVDKKYIIFQKNVSLTDKKGVLTTEELTYDMNNRIGTYGNGGKVVDGPTVITSRDGTYYAETQDVSFRNNVVLKDPSYDLTADSLWYNTQSQKATFITLTHIRDSLGRTVTTSEGYYDLHNHKANLGKRPKITDGSQSLIGEHVTFDDSTGISIATGNAVFRDTAQGIVLQSNLMILNKKTNSMLATEKPLMILKQDQDSFYIRADTLFSGRIPDSLLIKKDSLGNILPLDTAAMKNDSSLRYLQAYHHVRIFSDSLQGVADSLYYSGLDSVFRMFTNPVIWAEGRQVTGDTIYLYTKNKKPERMYVFENGLAVSRSGKNMFDQVKGNTLNGYFKDGNIDYMRAKGSAESIYFIKDDSLAFVGVNRVSRASIIDMIFVNKDLDRVVLRNDADGTMYPIRKVNLDDMRLRGFKWLEARRPKTKFELFEN